MNVNIMTWNTQLYEYENEVGNRIKEIDDGLFDAAIKLIDQHLEKENAIAVLQEVPYKCNITWEEHELFRQFKEHYLEDQYTVIYNISSKSQIKMTVVISKNGVIERCQCEKNNCYVPFRIKNTDIIALAVHAHTASECHEYIKRNINEKYNLILGDFNAGNYIKENPSQEFIKNRKNYLLLTEGYIDLCQGEYTTTYHTYIDHILLESSFDFLSGHKYSNINVNKDINLSDHHPITFELWVQPAK